MKRNIVSSDFLVEIFMDFHVISGIQMDKHGEVEASC